MKLFRSYSKQSDEQLMVLLQKGDHRAFSQLYDRYAGRMKAFFFRMLWSDISMADDFVHDLFTRIIERPGLFNADHSFSSWLFQVASNMCKNAYRKRSFEIEYLGQLEQTGIQIPSVDQKIDEQIITDHLHLALEQIGEEKRELFLLRYQQQLSTKELAVIFETTEGTIKSRLFYIRKGLLESINERKSIKEDGK